MPRDKQQTTRVPEPKHLFKLCADVREMNAQINPRGGFICSLLQCAAINICPAAAEFCEGGVALGPAKLT